MMKGQETGQEMWKDHKDVGVADLEGGEAWGGGSQLTPNCPNETPKQRSHWPWMSMWIGGNGGLWA